MISNYSNECFVISGATLPVPFNIIPSPKSLYRLYQRVFLCKKKSPMNIVDRTHQPSIDGENFLPVMIQRPSSINQHLNPNSQASLSTISNGQMRRKSFDINQTLTYRKVMERVIKRFLLHKQREEQDEIREGDFEELKQDIQMLRFEMMNRLDETRDDLAKNSLLLNEGVLVVGELLSSITRDSNPVIKENFHLFKTNFYSTLDRLRYEDSGLDSTDESLQTSISNIPSVTSTSSMPNLSTRDDSIRSIPTSNSEPSLSSEDSDTNPIYALKHLSAVHITLSNIAEEDEKEEEVEARHMSIQTSADEQIKDKSDDQTFSLKI